MPNVISPEKQDEMFIDFLVDKVKKYIVITKSNLFTMNDFHKFVTQHNEIDWLFIHYLRNPMVLIRAMNKKSGRIAKEGVMFEKGPFINGIRKWVFYVEGETHNEHNGDD